MRIVMAIVLTSVLVGPALAQKATGKKMDQATCVRMAQSNPSYTYKGTLTRGGVEAVKRCMQGQPI